MTEEAPDYIIRPGVNTNVHFTLPNLGQPTILSPTQMDRFNAWNANVATKTGLANGQVAVAGSGVSGAVQTNAIGIAPATSVAVDTTNMLVSQNFTSPNTIRAQHHWSWDGTDGNLTLGCARVFCDGMQSDLISNEIPVIAGESIEVLCQVKWEDISYTGTDPIILGVERYRKGRDPRTGGLTYLDLGGVDVSSLESPAANGGWGTDGDLAGIYVVEPGVDQLRFRFRAASNITSGIVKWDEAVFLKLDLIDDAAVPGVGTTVDDIVRQLFGSEGASFTHNEAAVALGNTSAAITSINSRLSAMEAETGPGSIAGDDFLWTGEITANANWGGGYSADAAAYGYYAADGSDAIFVLGSTPVATQEGRFDWQGIDDISASDYQLIQLVLSSGPMTSAGSYHSYIYLHGRVKSDWTSYIRAIISSDGSYTIGYVNGGGFVPMNTGSCTVPGAGSVISLYCGDKATTAPRNFRLVINNSTICQFNESGTGSALGASNRKWGWGFQIVQGVIYSIFTFSYVAIQGVGAKINQWLGYDQ